MGEVGRCWRAGDLIDLVDLIDKGGGRAVGEGGVVLVRWEQPHGPTRTRTDGHPAWAGQADAAVCFFYGELARQGGRGGRGMTMVAGWFLGCTRGEGAG